MGKYLAIVVAIIALASAPAFARGPAGGHAGGGGVHAHVGPMHGGAHIGGRGVGAGVGFRSIGIGAGIGRYGPCLNAWPIIYDPRCFY